MFHLRRLCEEGADNGAPLSKSGRFTEVYGVVLQRGPKNLQHIALGGLNASIHFVALKPFGFGDDGFYAALNGFIKCGLLSGMNADVDEFEDHDEWRELIFDSSLTWASLGQRHIRDILWLMSFTPSTAAAPLLWPMNWALPSGVQAVCTTRVGGVSQAPFDGFNLGDHVQDDPYAVAQNRALLQAQLGGARPVFLSQVHGAQVAQLSSVTPHGTKADACLTQELCVACTIMVADCLPLLFTDDAGQVVAAAHAGWRGLAAGVIEQTVHAMCDKAGVDPQQVRAWLGPCIGSDAFEVGEDVRVAFMANAHAAEVSQYFKPHPTHSDKWLADLAGLARWRLQALGVRSMAGNDSTAEWCTVAQRSRLFSFRRDGVTGRFAVCIWRN